MRDPGVLGDVADPRTVVSVLANTRTAARGCASACRRVRLNGQSTVARIELRSPGVQPLADTLVVDFTRYLPARTRVASSRGSAPASFASSPRAAIRCERQRPRGTPRCGRGASPSSASSPRAALAQALCARADVVLESFRPGVADRLGIGPGDVPDDDRLLLDHGVRRSPATHPRGPRRELPRLGRRPRGHRAGPPPVQIADLAAGALGAVTRVLAALLERRAPARARPRRFDDASLARPRRTPARRGAVARLLTGGLACYRLYGTAGRPPCDGGARSSRSSSSGSCELIGRPDLAERQFDADQDAARRASSQPSSARARSPTGSSSSATRTSASARSGRARRRRRCSAAEPARPVPLGAHTDAWRRELGDSVSETERRGQCEQRVDAIRLLQAALVPIDQDRPDPERPRALDVVLVGVADHRRLRPAATPSARERSAKIDGCGLTRPCACEPTAASTSSP